MVGTGVGRTWVLPKETETAQPRLTPKILIVCPPPRGPDDDEMLVTTGSPGGKYRKMTVPSEQPDAVQSNTWAGPGRDAGVKKDSEVSLAPVNDSCVAPPSTCPW